MDQLRVGAVLVATAALVGPRLLLPAASPSTCICHCEIGPATLYVVVAVAFLAGGLFALVGLSFAGRVRLLAPGAGEEAAPRAVGGFARRRLAA